MSIGRIASGLVTTLLICSSAFAVADGLGTVVRLSIRPQTVASALLEFSDQTKLQIVSVGSEVRGRDSPGAEGEWTAREGLTRLLEGTELQFELINEQTIRVFASDMVKRSSAGRTSPTSARGSVPAYPLAQVQQNTAIAPARSDAERQPEERDQKPLETVTVFGRGTEDTVREIPQTLDVFQADFIEDIQADVLDDVLRFVPNSFGTNWSPPLYTQFTIRGFAARQTWNGLGYFGDSSSYTPPNMVNVERVEVLKGPASVLYGAMEPGAVINIVTKRPQAEFQAEGSLKYGTYNDATLTFDVGGPLSDRLRTRVSAAYNTTDTIFDHAGTLTDLFVAPTAEFDLSADTLLTIDGYYSNRYWSNGAVDGQMPLALTGQGFLPNPVGEFPQSTNFRYDENISAPDGYGDLENTRKATVLHARLAHSFTDTASLNAAFSYRHDQRYEEGLLVGSLAADNRTLSRRYRISDDPPGDAYLAHLDFRGELSTGPVLHTLILGVDYHDSTYTNRFAIVNVTPIDIYTPVYGTVVLPDPFPFSEFELRTKISETFVQDRLSFGDWHLMAGARISDFHQESDFTPFGGTLGTSIIDDTISSTQFGVLYDVNDSVTLFVSRNESFVPRSYLTPQGEEADNPEISVQYEGGVKFAFPNTSISADLTYFNIQKDDVFVFDFNTGFVTPVGQLTSDGIEASIEGRPTPGLTFYVGYGYNMTEITKAAENVGNEFRNSPNHTFSTFVRYDIQSGPLAGLGFSGSLNHVSERWESESNDIEYPPYTRIDLGAYYPVTERVDVSLYVQNLTEAKIIDGFGFGIARYTKDQTVFGKLTVRF